MQLRTISAEKVKNKTVLVRADYNVPLKKNGASFVVADDNRIQLSLETINFLLQAQAKVVICGHLGRPEGDGEVDLSLKPVAAHLQKLLGEKVPVVFSPDCVGEIAQAAVAQLQVGQVLVLENLRFHPQEKKNEAAFCKQLAELADVYVNEAFSTAHRQHASIVGITKYLPSYAGFAFAKEVATFTKLMSEPKRPFVMVIGGAKISDKVAAVEHLTQIADAVLVGGGVANNFLKAEGFDIAKSYLQDKPADLKKTGVDYVEVAEDLIQETKRDRLLKDGYIPLPKIIYPTDVLAAPSLNSKTSEEIELVNGQRADAIKRNLMFLDIGPKTIRLFKEVILHAGTVFWNGPMGVFENSTFAHGTQEIANAIAKSGATTILGGGDTIAAIRHFKLEDRFDYVSAAGGAALDFLSGQMLPGVKPLLKK